MPRKMMSNMFFKDLGIPKPTMRLEASSGSHAVQTAEIMKRFEPVVLRERLKKLHASRRGNNDNASKSVKVFS